MNRNYLGRLYFRCENHASPGHVLQVDTDGKLVTGYIDARNIVRDGIGLDQIAGLDQLIFGYPIDGSFVADGVTAMLGVAPSGMEYTLTRDVNFKRLIVNSGVSINTNGYRLFANALQLNGTAVVHNDGSDGAAGSTLGLGGAGGAAAGAGSISYTADGGKAGGSGASTKPGSPGKSGWLVQPSLGGVGGRGGTGTSSTFGGGSGGVQGGVAPPSLSVLHYPSIVELTDRRVVRGVAGGSGGSGGGGGGAGAGAGGGGGGGGAGGGVCFLAAGFLDLISGAWSGRISANGGDGGNGAAGDGAGTGGVGGGGGGGFVLVVARRIAGHLPVSTVSGIDPVGHAIARAGAAGASGNPTGVVAASPGQVVIVNLSQPFSSPDELGRPAVLDARPMYPSKSVPIGQYSSLNR